MFSVIFESSAQVSEDPYSRLSGKSEPIVRLLVPVYLILSSWLLPLILVLLLFPDDAHMRKESQNIHNVNIFVADSGRDVPHIIWD